MGLNLRNGVRVICREIDEFDAIGICQPHHGLGVEIDVDAWPRLPTSIPTSDLPSIKQKTLQREHEPPTRRRDKFFTGVIFTARSSEQTETLSHSPACRHLDANVGRLVETKVADLLLDALRYRRYQAKDVPCNDTVVPKHTLAL